MANSIAYVPIGVIHSKFKEPKGVPIQSAAAKGIEGTVEVFPEYVEGLKDLEGFSHIILIYHFHLSRHSTLKVKPYMDDRMHGVFATRAPARPNPIDRHFSGKARWDREKCALYSGCGYCGRNTASGYQTLCPRVRCKES